MKQKPNGPAIINISLPKALLSDIDRRADSLGLPRSQYLSLLAKRDLRELGPLLLYGEEATNTGEVQLSAQDYAFLTAAIPELETWEQHKRLGLPMPQPPPAPSETLQQIWKRFIDQRESIMVHKWIESQKAGHDIGIERAIRDWLNLISR